MTDEQIEYAIGKLKAYSTVDSADAFKRGIGCMTAHNYDRFAADLIKLGLLTPGLDYSRA